MPLLHTPSAQPAIAAGTAGTSLSSTTLVSTPPTQRWTWQSPAVCVTPDGGVPSGTPAGMQMPLAPSQTATLQEPGSGQSAALVHLTVHVPAMQVPALPPREQT